MTDKNHHKPKMAPKPDAPPGIETDGKANVIPFAERTPDDQAKTTEALRKALHADDKPIDE